MGSFYLVYISFVSFDMRKHNDAAKAGKMKTGRPLSAPSPVGEKGKGRKRKRREEKSKKPTSEKKRPGKAVDK